MTSHQPAVASLPARSRVLDAELVVLRRPCRFVAPVASITYNIRTILPMDHHSVLYCTFDWSTPHHNFRMRSHISIRSIASNHNNTFRSCHMDCRCSEQRNYFHCSHVCNYNWSYRWQPYMQCSGTAVHMRSLRVCGTESDCYRNSTWVRGRVQVSA
jgi:hypothetical protein